MSQSLIIGLLQNASILLAFAVLYDFFNVKKEKSKSWINQLGIGLIIGILGIILIATPWTMVPGITFDTRSILLSVTGLFFGSLTTVVAIVLTGAYRVYLGGNGIYMGIAVILTSGCAGLMWRHFRPNWDKKNYRIELISMGFVVHVLMILCSLLLPAEVIIKTINTIAFPVIVIYPLVTMLLGTVIQYRLKSRKTEQELLSSEERWKFALEGSGDGVWDWNVETNEVFFSKQWKNMLGFKEDEIENNLEEWEKRVHPNDKEQVYSDLNSHFEGKIPYYINEHRVLSKDGSYKWILDRGKVMSWTIDKKPVRVIGTHTDISERKNAEEELKKGLKREQFLADIIRNASVAVAVGYPNGIIGMCNKAFQNLTGYSEHELKEIQWNTVLTPVEWQQHETSQLEIINQTKKSLKYEKEYIHKKGYKIPIELVVNPFFDEEGNVTHYYAFISDLTERKKAEIALMKEKNLLSAIIENIPVMITRYDPDSKKLYLNKEFEEKIGWKTEEINKIDLMEEVYPDPYYRQQALDFMQQASAQWKEFQIQSKSAKVIDSEWCNIRLDDGTQIGIGIDITVEKKAREEIRKFNEELELLVSERTKEIGEKNLELERMNKLFVGRELRMKELKEMLKELKEKQEEKNK